MSFTFAFLFCVVSGSQQIGEAVDGEFRAFRLQQYEINGNLFGSRSNRVQFEAVTLNSKNLRRCVVTTWRQLLDKDIDDVLSATAGAVLVFIPSDLDSLSAEDVKAFGQFEKKLLRVRTDLSIYFSPSSSETPSIVSNLVNTPSGQSATATEQLFNTLTADTVQISTIDTSAPESLTYKPKNVVGFLSSGDPSAPTIAFVAHYDSHAVAPGLAAGSDSNGSGIVALLELLAVLGKFYDSTTTRPPYNLLFLWTAGGKLNYQGAMHWINEYQKGTEDQKLELAICLEAIGRARDGTLRMHASTDPKSATANFLKRLTSVANGKKIEVVKKKISLSNVSSWEHEKFNIKRMPAITLSTLPNAFDESRTSLLDIPAKLDVDELASNIRIIAEATLSYILELPEQGSTDSRVTSDKTMLARDAIDKTRIHHYVRQFASKPRPLSDKHATLATSANIAAAAGTFAHVTTSAVTITDARVYSGIENTLISERVKPAVFELVIMSGIMAYLSFFYFITSNAQSLIASASFQIKKALC